jgi:hypothetical protein
MQCLQTYCVTTLYIRTKRMHTVVATEAHGCSTRIKRQRTRTGWFALCYAPVWDACYLGFFIIVNVGREFRKLPISHVNHGFASGGEFTNLTDPLAASKSAAYVRRSFVEYSVSALHPRVPG